MPERRAEEEGRHVRLHGAIKGGTATVVVTQVNGINKYSYRANDERIGEGRLDKTIPISATTYAGMDIGRDNGLVVDLDYGDKAPYAFTGTLKQVVFDLKPAGTHDDEQALHEHATIHAVAHGVSA